MLSFNFRKSEAELFDEPIILEASTSSYQTVICKEMYICLMPFYIYVVNVVLLQVFNARGLFRSNALLGFFKVCFWNSFLISDLVAYASKSWF